MDMDSLSDAEISSIWERLKDYIDPSQLQEGTIDEIAEQIRYRLEAMETPNKQQKQTLITHDFADRAVQVPEIVAELPIKGRVLLGESGVEKPTLDSPLELVWLDEKPKYRVKEGVKVKFDEMEFGSGEIVSDEYMEKARPLANPKAKVGEVVVQKPPSFLETTIGTLRRVSIKGRERFQAGQKLEFEGRQYRRGWFVPSRAYQKKQ